MSEIVDMYHGEPIPLENIPEEFRIELPLVGGGVQIVDSRWGIYYFCGDAQAWVPRYAGEMDEIFE
jgi:hypothetical protein